MKRRPTLPVLVALLCLLGASRADAVVGGTPVTQRSHPAVIKLEGCTASLISPERILTAAHCISGMTPTRTVLRIGGHRYRVRRVARDPRYRYVQHHYTSTIPYAPPYDVAIAELDRPVTGVSPLPLHAEAVVPGTAAKVIGYGVNTVGGTFGTLRVASIVARSDATCLRTLARASKPQSKLYQPGLMLCAQDPDGRAPYRAACNGDSGSPLLVHAHGRTEIAGVDSWGVACGTRHNDPEVYMTIPSVLSFVTAASPAWAPEPVGAPTITGIPTVGSTLTCVSPVWAGTPPIAQRYDWITPQSGATGPTYVVRPQDAAGRITCRVEADIAGGGTFYFPSRSVAVGSQGARTTALPSSPRRSRSSGP
jgi:hypothetical protein